MGVNKLNFNLKGRYLSDDDVAKGYLNKYTKTAQTVVIADVERERSAGERVDVFDSLRLGRGRVRAVRGSTRDLHRTNSISPDSGCRRRWKRSPRSNFTATC